MIHRFVIRNRHRNEYAGASKGTRLPASHHGVVRMVQNLGSTAPGTLETRGSWLHATVAVCTVFFLSYFVAMLGGVLDRKSTRLNSSHLGISYAVFCLKKKKKI